MADDINEQVEQQLEELQQNVRSVLDLEEQIQDGKDAKEGVADLKEKVQKISVRNSELVDDLKEAAEEQKQVRSDLNERIDKLEVSIKDGQGSRQGVRAAASYFAEKLQDKWDRRDPRRISVRMDEDTEAVRSMRGVTGAAGNVRGITNAPGSAGDIITPDYDEDMIFIPREQPRVAQQITTFPTSSDVVIDRREKDHASGVGPNAGSQQGQATTKPESNYEFTSAQSIVQTIATFQQISTQVLDDRGRLEGEVRFMMERDLALEVDRQVLYGGGNAVNELEGMIPNSTAFDAGLESVVGGTSVTNIDRVRLMILQVALANLTASGIMMNPQSWAGIELTKDGDNSYIFVRPQETASPNLWGLPVTPTTIMGTDDYLVADLVSSVRLYDRQQPSVRVSEEHGTNFTDNEATLLTELRAAQAIRRSSGIVYYDDSAV